MTSTTDIVDAPAVAARFIRWLESGQAPDGLFADDVFFDASFPRWRVQVDNVIDALALRSARHRSPSAVHVERLEPTSRGFTLEIEERYQYGHEDWYARMMFRADVESGRIVELAVYCTGDWDEARRREHAEEVTLIRP
jgi:hypothetical protein